MLARQPSYQGGAENPQFKDKVYFDKEKKGERIKNVSLWRILLFFLHLIICCNLWYKNFHLLLLVDLALAARPLVQHRTLQLWPALPALLHLPITISNWQSTWYNSDSQIGPNKVVIPLLPRQNMDSPERSLRCSDICQHILQKNIILSELFGKNYQITWFTAILNLVKQN